MSVASTTKNYLLQPAKDILSYKAFVQRYAGEPVVAIGNDVPLGERITHYLSILRTPRFEADAPAVLDQLEKLTKSSPETWTEPVEMYVRSIFPAFPPRCPDSISDHQLQAVKANAEWAVRTAKQMNTLSYMLTKSPEQWREWSLLKPVPVNKKAIAMALDRLFADHGQDLDEFMDASGYLIVQSYSDLLSFVDFHLSNGDNKDLQRRGRALTDAVSCFQRYGLYKAKKVKDQYKWTMDVFRFERPDVIAGGFVPGSKGVIRVVMPAGHAGVGLKNHFPHEAYRVVCSQCDRYTDPAQRATRSGSGLSDTDLLEVLAAVYVESKGKGKMLKSEVIKKLNKKSLELKGTEISMNNAAEGQTRWLLARLKRIDPNLAAAATEWLDDLKAGTAK